MLLFEKQINTGFIMLVLILFEYKSYYIVNQSRISLKF